ncbi:MAG: hypothetical protein M5U28_46460 [Sandaracinaceae bacterium]|nr:hypothetical protein [Sandaracinaceae bacterium]
MVDFTEALPERHVARTFTYDTVGRRLASDDPDTDDPTGSSGSNTWRYLFNRVGDLVAVRDPRGAARTPTTTSAAALAGEQYVSCGEAQSHAAERPHEDNAAGDLIAMAYSSTEVSLDVVYYYDEYPSAWGTRGPRSSASTSASPPSAGPRP